MCSSALSGWASVPFTRIPVTGGNEAGGFHWADLVPRSGTEQLSRRPVIGASHDGFRQTPGWRSIIIVPISTSQDKRGFTGIEIPGGSAGLAKTSIPVGQRMTTLDRAKLSKTIGALPPALLGEVGMGLKAAKDLE